MKIRNLMAPVVALAVCGTAALQAQNPTPTQGTQNQTQNQGTLQQDTSRNQRQDTTQQLAARQHVDQLLQGITLTAQQRTKIDSLVQKFSTAQQGGMQQGSVTEEPQDTARTQSSSSSSTASADTTQTRSYGGQTPNQQNIAQRFTQLDAQVRAVLTPQQQNIWDRNVGTLRNSGKPQR